jgi:glycosyltransferase involved in cell wall biosynthesis
MTYPGQLVTIPIAINSLKLLANEAKQVDAYIWEPESGLKGKLAGNIRIHARDQPPYGRLRWLLLRFPWLYRLGLRLRFSFKFRYDCVFAIGQMGTYAGSLMATASRCPLVYINDEFPETSGHPPRWMSLEKQAAAKASVIVVPDESRVAPLLDQLQCEPAAIAVLPNSPLTGDDSPEIEWRSRLGIPENTSPILHAGTIHDWMQVPELLYSVRYWPEDSVLILQTPNYDPAYRRQLSHLEIEGRIIWNEAPLSEPELNSLVRFCRGSVALYRHVDDNMFYMGYASGKIMRSLACGTPVITSNFPSLNFVSANSLGFQVAHPSEIPDTVSMLLAKREELSRECLRYFEEHCRFEDGWTRVMDSLDPAPPR